MIPAHPGLAGGPVYLDYNSTTPVDPRVVEAMRPYLADWFGNPSSDHAYAAEPKAARHRARTQVAELIGAETGEIVFTGPGSEGNNLALRGAVLAAKVDRPHVITQVTEHPAVLETCRALERAEVGLEPSAKLVDAVRPPASSCISRGCADRRTEDDHASDHRSIRRANRHQGRSGRRGTADANCRRRGCTGIQPRRRARCWGRQRASTTRAGSRRCTTAGSRRKG
ncbi:aminotransferase class V-fold PLP-dependent enzyme [Streptomyces lunaelactis]|uniref:aminotransferase class V-fold PLP-dependent enzyme n=2 Tax=Streptomyces lunaelactis TaxID=1535768 RepID=UPI002814C8D1|nr:aminotransferase class V-fold PLP-dependent enzyme [Streptomyces lunaelactis]